MIYLAGDIHGGYEIYKVIQFFEKESRARTLTKDDYLILLGDVGLYWDGAEKDKYVADTLNELPVTVLWIDGNHENFSLLDELPISDWNGGKVQFTGDKIIRLMRGQVYDICDKKIFSFGGGFSIDKEYRVENETWWSREMPCDEEYRTGKETLLHYNNQVDYIITHTVPGSLGSKLVKTQIEGEEQLQNYFQEIAETVSFEKWFFGHWHKDVNLCNGKFIGLYDKIVRLDV